MPYTVRRNPGFDGSKRQEFPRIPRPTPKKNPSVKRTAVYSPTGDRVSVNWEANGPKGQRRKGPWWWVSFPNPVSGLTETNRDGIHSAVVHDSTLVEWKDHIVGAKNPRRAGKWSAVCLSCYSARVDNVPKKDAERWATSHMGQFGHNVTVQQEGVKKNPPLMVLGNPGRKRVGILSKRVIALQYKHAEDGQLYEHKFKAGDCLEVLSDGSFRVYNMSGKRLWKDF